jgi:hypothetical protein
MFEAVVGPELIEDPFVFAQGELDAKGLVGLLERNDKFSASGLCFQRTLRKLPKAWLCE